MLTRRCAGRAFRLRPSERTNQIFEYCLALAASRTGVVILAVCVMSDHYHVILIDVHGLIPDFARELNRMLAKVMNVSQGQSENLWSLERAHYLELGDEQDVLARIAYLAANPVAAGLVATPDEWPGVMHLPGEVSEVIRVERPEEYFGPRSRAPKEVELRICPPSNIENLAERVAALVAERVEAAQAKMRAEGRKFLGRAAVLATSIVQRAKSMEARRTSIPKMAAQSREVRTRLREAYREFTRAYHAALETWRAGVREVAFPHGTWWMRVFHRVAVALPA